MHWSKVPESITPEPMSKLIRLISGIMMSWGRFISLVLTIALMARALGQPPVVVQNEVWNAGTHHFSLAVPIISPGDPSAPVSISAAADVLFVSAAQVHLTDGFHAGMFNGTGRFHAFIDPTIFPDPDPSSPTVYQVGEFTDIESRTIDLSKAVGAIKGSASVNNMGAAIYSIPIPLPPGTNGIAPKLAIVYNSRGPDGPLGTGWSLAGTSSIVRTGKDFFHDQACTPIQFGPDDRFWLDGQRLVLTNGGPYGAPGSQYDTEVASFATITAEGSYGSGPASFTVVTKDGLTMEYGTNESAIRTTDDQEVLIWRLSRIRDAYGNTVKYTYADIDGEPLLQGISYTSNDALGYGAYCTVSFEYSIRSDPGMTCLPGRILIQRHLLDRITVAVTAVDNGTVTTHTYRTLELKYVLRDIGKSYLSEVIEHGRDNAATLNSTVFQYVEQPVAAVEGTSISIPFSEMSDVYTGDYDGDGLSDLLRAYYEIDQGHKWVTQLRIYTATGSAPWTYDLSSTPFYAALANSGDNYQSFINADFNGDGKDDICIVYFQYSPDASGSIFDIVLKKVQLLLSDTSDPSFFLAYTTVDYSPPDAVFSCIKDPTNSIQCGDFDGDGKSELIVHCVTPNDYGLYKLYMLKDGAWTNLPVPAGTDDHNLKNPDRLMVVDVNGDRKHDLLALKSYLNNWNYPNTCSVFSWNGAAMENISTSAIPSATESSGPEEDAVYAVYPGDFNGDGKTDLLVNAALSQTDDKWRIYFSSGSAYTSSYASFTFDPVPTWPDDRFRIVVADFNGDGRSDIFHFHNPYNNFNLSIYYSTGQSGNNQLFYRNDLQVGNLGLLRPCDQNGDGRADIISFTGWTQPLSTLLIKPQGQERLVQKVSNGMGAIDEFVYGPSSFLFPPTDGSWPIIRKRPITDLVTTHIRPNGIGGVTTTNFAYGDPYFELTGRGFLGFCTLLNTEGAWQSLNTFTVQEAKALLLPATSRKSNNSYALVTAKQFLPVIVDVSNGRYTVQMPIEITTDVLSATSKITTRSYDEYGNVTQATVTSSTVSPAATVDVEATTTQYEAYGPSPVPAKPTLITVQRTRAGAPQVSKTTKLDYNAQGALFRKTDFYGTPNWVKSEFTFNERGLVTGKTVTTATSGTNGAQSETYAYDPTGRFVTTKQTKYYDGATYWMTSSADYDIFRGLPTKVTGPDGLSTDHSYDAFDHLLTESAPYLNSPDPARTITHALEWDLQAPAKYYRTTTQDPARPDVTTWFDQLGRQTSQETETFSGAYTTSATSYDYLGRVQRVTAPHLPGEPEVYEEKTYDALDRVVTSTSSVSGTTTFAYSYDSGLSKVTATSPANHVTETTKDCTGLLVSSRDDGGTLTYTYDSWGNLLTTAHDGTTLVTNTYDPYGRQTQLTDAAAGTTEYTYDAWGRLVYQEDANGNAINLTYDNLGRLKTKGEIVYTYYHEGDRFTALPASITEGAASTTFAYDDLLRLTSKAKVIDGETFTTQYTYDAYDNVATMQFPSGVTVGYTYAQHCFLDQVTYGEVTLYDVLATNGQGQITSYALGDGNTTQITYTDGRPTRFYAPGVQDLNMLYDPATGNLTYRWDKLVQRQESFAYDALDRLTGATVNEVDASGTATALVADLTYLYDGDVGSGTAGDLIQRTDIGKFNYSPSHAPSDAFGDTPGATAPAAINQGTQAISYTTFLKAATIGEQIGSDAYLLTYTYGTDHQRAKSELKKNGNNIESRIYCGAYEEQRLPGTTNKVHYVNGPSGLCAMIVQADGVETIYYVYKDHLGSIVTLTTEQGGVATIAAQQNFDPWGRRRNPTDWTYENIPGQPDWLYRGYTGHEHVESFALINMNGRMYDPLNGRMLGADNYVQDFLGSQGFNRYSYAGNNPLKYTDPSGELVCFVPMIIGAVIGIAVGGASHARTLDFTTWSGDSWKAAAIGGIIGAGLGFAASYGLAASGANITGISASGFTHAAGLSGAHTMGWNITSNALITANLNLTSASLQGRGLDGVFQSGIIGLASGALGGLAGHLSNSSQIFSMSTNSVRIQNYVTSGLNGFGDRMSLAYARGDRHSDLWRNALKGMGEGLLSANLVNNNFIFDGAGLIETGSTANTLTTGGQYLSSALTQAVTSVPGAGYTLYSYYSILGMGKVLGNKNALGGVGLGMTAVLHVGPISILNWWMGDDYPAVIHPRALWEY